MATSGSFTSSWVEGYSMRHDWELLSQDISTLKSVIKVTSYMIVASGYNFYGVGIRSSININGVAGQTYKQTSASYSPQTLTIGSVNLTVTHESDGSFSNKTFTASTPTGMKWASGTMSASGTITLPSIARASTFTIADNSINLGEALSVSISRASTSFTHTVKYIYGSQTVSHTGVATSDSYTTPLSWSSQVPNGTLLSGTIVVETYLSGSLIGSNSATFKAYVPSSVVPTITSLGLTGASLLDGVYVKGKSKVTATINGEAGAYGSTISSRSIIGGGYSSTADSFQTGFLNMVGTNTFTAKVTDSRGRTATKTASVVVYDYALPVLTATAQRVNDSGSYDPNGTRVKVTASMSFSSVNSKNSKTLLRFKYKTSTGSWSGYTTITGTHYFTASVDYPYTVYIEYADEISGTLARQVDVPPSISSIDVKAGGDGIAFGGSATKANTAEFFYDVEFNGDVEINGDANVSRHKSDEVGNGAVLNFLWQDVGYTQNARLRHEVIDSHRAGFGLILEAEEGSDPCYFETSGEIYADGDKRVYHTGYKPTASDVGALPLSGGTMTGDLLVNGGIFTSLGGKAQIAYGTEDCNYIGSTGRRLYLQTNNPEVLINSDINWWRVYHEGYKNATWRDIYFNDSGTDGAINFDASGLKYCIVEARLGVNTLLSCITMQTKGSFTISDTTQSYGFTYSNTGISARTHGTAGGKIYHVTGIEIQ